MAQRRPWLAALLSLLAIGTGHYYCGRVRRGLVLLLVFIILNFIAVGILSFFPFDVSRFILFSYQINLLIWLFAIIDAYLIARRFKKRYTLKAYNRWYVYPVSVLFYWGIYFGAVFACRAILITAFTTASNSMYPTIHVGEKILARKLAYINNDPEKGDIVVFLNPMNVKTKFVKRIVAVAGDTVEMRNNELFINDEKFTLARVEPSVFKDSHDGVESEHEGAIFLETIGEVKYHIFLKNSSKNRQCNFIEISVPENHCFVLGDNRDLSYDSRHFGPIHVDSIIGKADYLCSSDESWPRLERLGPNRVVNR